MTRFVDVNSEESLWEVAVVNTPTNVVPELVVEFVSYSGEYPTLCFGELVLNINGRLLNSCRLGSGGRCYFADDDYTNEIVEHRPWGVSFDTNDELVQELFERFGRERLEQEVLEVVNSNVEHGCCGGCL